MSSTYFMAGNVREKYDLFNGQHGFLFSLFDEIRENKNLKELLWQAVKSGFILDPSDDGLKRDIIAKGQDHFFTPLIYTNKTIYRRVFENRQEAKQFAKENRLSEKVLKQAMINAITHELGHHLWRYLDDKQRVGWQNLVLDGDADIDYELLEKGYPDEYKKLDEEAFCSFLNAYVCPDAKNLSGAKLTLKIEKFLKTTLNLN